VVDLRFNSLVRVAFFKNFSYDRTPTPATIANPLRGFVMEAKRCFSCLASKSYQPGDELQAILEVTLRIGNGRRKADLALQCRVEVVRTGGCHSGVACRITDYMVIPRPEA